MLMAHKQTEYMSVIVRYYDTINIDITNTPCNEIIPYVSS
jgi:hypothetical protein